MKEFPSLLKPKNIGKFEESMYHRVLCYLRRDIYEHVLSHKEEEYFSLDKFNSEKVNDIKKTIKMVDELIPELEKLGWKVKKSYGDTALFIYSTPEPPKNCYENELLG
jgi:hypothetical protein